MKKYIIDILLIITTTSNISGNTPQDIPSSRKDTISIRNTTYDVDIPNYVSMSPEMAGLFRYVEYNGDLSSGVMTTSIPIYEIKCGPLSLPLSLGYEASGRRISEVTGQIGIGWTLNAGGAIVRSVKGNPYIHSSVSSTGIQEMTMNEIKEKLYSNDYNTRKDYHRKLEEISDGYFDSEYDIFSYTIPGHAGYFIVRDTRPIILNEDPVEIEYRNIENGFANGFSIIDDKGNVYLFNTYDVGGVSTGAIEWRLAEIQSIDKQYTIKFNYDRIWIENKESYTAGETVTLTDCYSLCDNGTPLPFLSCIDECSPSDTYLQRASPLMIPPHKWVYRLSEIEFNLGKIKFNNDQLNGVLNSIDIKNNDNNTLKSLILSHSELESGKKWLNAIEWHDSSNRCIEKYHFDYYPTTSLTYEHVQHCASDFWGFRNRIHPTAGWMPKIEWERTTYSGVQLKGTSLENWSFREPNYLETQKGVMKKITYPTGGTTEYIYEGNSYWSAITKKEEKAGGIRIKEITTVTKGDSIKTKLEYSSGRLLVDPKSNIRRSISDNVIIYTDGFKQYPSPPNAYSTVYRINRVHTFSSEFVDDVAFLANIPVFYNTVTKYNISKKKGESTKTIYKYSERYNELLNSQLRHSHINVSERNIGINLKVINSYLSRNFRSPDPKPYIPFYSYFWKKNNLLEEKHFINDGQDNYKPFKTISYTYIDIPTDTIKGLKIERFFILSSMSPSVSDITGYLIQHDCRVPFFQFADYYISKGKTELVAKTEIYHDSGFTTTTTYEYACHEIQDEFSPRYGKCDFSYLRATKMQNSKGDTIREEMIYPFDLCNPNNVYQQMLDKNIISLIIEQSQYKNEVFLQKRKTSYKNWGNNLYLPETIQLQTNKQPIVEPRIIYHRYDKYGNPLFITKDDATKIVYLWSYGGQYPIAEIKNATYEEVSSILGKDFIDRLSSLLTLSDNDKKKINELRSKLPNSLVTTYTYKPLVGILTISDPRGMTTHYEYDTLGRLKYIQDHSGKKIKEYDYNYYH